MHLKQFSRYWTCDNGRTVTSKKQTNNASPVSARLLSWESFPATCREGSPSSAQLIPCIEDMRWKSGESKSAGFYRAKGQREDCCTEKEPQGSAKSHPWVRRVIISSGMCRNHAQLMTEPPKQTGGTVSTITKGEEQCLLPTRRYKTSSIDSISLDRALRIVLTQ